MAQPSNILNINVGVLGHVDSGKTSLVAALSTTLSTAALDKHPQSKQRGITLDLGFSALTVPKPDHLADMPCTEIQCTLVDCPGHASLIRTIIGGAQIIDVMLLVVDVTKGIQTQTAECLVIGELCAGGMVVVLNKVDLLPEPQRARLITKAIKRIAATLQYTKFAGCPIVPMAAAPGARPFSSTSPPTDTNTSPGPPSPLPTTTHAATIPTLLDHLLRVAPLHHRARTQHTTNTTLANDSTPNNNNNNKTNTTTTTNNNEKNNTPLRMAVDHCFAIKGKGTILTGTVLQGSIHVGNEVELAGMHIQRKVKSMQMFKRPVQWAHAGDRVGVCVTQLEAGGIERALVCTPGSVPTMTAAVVSVERVRFFAGQVLSGSKIHITAGHATTLAQVTFFGHHAAPTTTTNTHHPVFDPDQEYVYQEKLLGPDGMVAGERDDGNGGGDVASSDGSKTGDVYRQWAYAVFASPLTAPMNALCIGARLDDPGTGSTCRIAFSGHIAMAIDPTGPLSHVLRVYKRKQREGFVERVLPDGRSVVVRDMLKKETDVRAFVGRTVTTSDNIEGVIEGGFGKSGKIKVVLCGDEGVMPAVGSKVVLQYKRFLFDNTLKKTLQQ